MPGYEAKVMPQACCLAYFSSKNGLQHGILHVTEAVKALRG